MNYFAIVSLVASVFVLASALFNITANQNAKLAWKRSDKGKRYLSTEEVALTDTDRRKRFLWIALFSMVPLFFSLLYILR